MGETDRKRVRGVIIGRFGQAEERSYHEGDLIFSRASAPDGSLFDSRGRVFENRQSIFRRGKYRRATRRAEEDGGLVALHINDRFKRATIRLMFANQLRKLIANRDQTR